jgi:hypothetical protein
MQTANSKRRGRRSQGAGAKRVLRVCCWRDRRLPSCCYANLIGFDRVGGDHEHLPACNAPDGRDQACVVRPLVEIDLLQYSALFADSLFSHPGKPFVRTLERTFDAKAGTLRAADTLPHSCIVAGFNTASNKSSKLQTFPAIHAITTAQRRCHCWASRLLRTMSLFAALCGGR